MPIKGLTDRGLSFPEIGQIRKGAPKPERGPGKDLQYFRVTFDEREQEAERVFRQRYGDEPDTINIFLPFNEIERQWDAWLEAYLAGRMVARSDGEVILYLVDVKTGEILVKNGVDLKTGQPRRYVEGQPVGTWRSKAGKDEMIYLEPSGRLKVIVPELARAAYLTVITGSIHDIINISAQLEAFKRLNGGRISGIPLVLRRRPKRISVPSDEGASRVRRTKWMLSVEADPEWVKMMLLETKRHALPGNGLVLLPDRTPQDDVTDYDVDADAVEVDVEDEYEPEPELYGTGETITEYREREIKPRTTNITLVGWDAWDKKVAIALERGVPIPKIDETTVTKDQMRAAYDELLKALNG